MRMEICALIRMKEAAGRSEDTTGIEHLRMRLKDDAGKRSKRRESARCSSHVG